MNEKYSIGIDLGGTNIKAGLCNYVGDLIIKKSVKVGKSATATEIVEAMASLCRSLLVDTEIPMESIDYVGLAAPGTADADKGMIVYANNLPFMKYPIADEFIKRFPVSKLYIENDANAAALGEAMCGGAKGLSDVVVVTLGTGVGGGVIIKKHVLSGFNFAAGELGHMVIDVGGRPCSCGRKGCWEAYSSATALINFTKEAMRKDIESAMWEICGGDIDKVDGQTAFRAAEKNDKSAKIVVHDYILNLACGIVNIINIFQPEAICVGGGISNEGDNLFKPLLEYINLEQYSRYCEKKTDIRLALLGNDAGIIGAAMLGRQD